MRVTTTGKKKTSSTVVSETKAAKNSQLQNKQAEVRIYIKKRLIKKQTANPADMLSEKINH